MSTDTINLEPDWAGMRRWVTEMNRTDPVTAEKIADAMGSEAPALIVDNPGAENEALTVYADSRRDGSVYTLEDGELIQRPKFADGGFEDGVDEGGVVDWDRGVADEDVEYLRDVEKRLREARA